MPLVSPHRRPPTPGGVEVAAVATAVLLRAPKRVQGAPVVRVVPAPSGYYHAPTKLSNRKLIQNALVRRACETTSLRAPA
jgi:hypothetical protein